MLSLGDDVIGRAQLACEKKQDSQQTRWFCRIKASTDVHLMPFSLCFVYVSWNFEWVFVSSQSRYGLSEAPHYLRWRRHLAVVYWGQVGQAVQGYCHFHVKDISLTSLSDCRLWWTCWLSSTKNDCSFIIYLYAYLNLLCWLRLNE